MPSSYSLEASEIKFAEELNFGKRYFKGRLKYPTFTDSYDFVTIQYDYYENKWQCIDSKYKEVYYESADFRAVVKRASYITNDGSQLITVHIQNNSPVLSDLKLIYGQDLYHKCRLEQELINHQLLAI